MNPYEVLEIPPDASDKDIKDAYKAMAKKWHPDKNKAPEATEKFKEISKAYTILIDPQLRQRFDQTGSVDDQQGPNEVDINEILRGMGMGMSGMAGMGGMPGGMPFPFMGGMGGIPGMPGMGGVFVNGVPMGMGGGGMNPQEMFMRRNCNIKISIQIPLIDLFNGLKKNLDYQYKDLEGGMMLKDSLDLNILKGSHDGQEILFKNKGHKFKNTRGDLIVQIKEVPHKDFSRTNGNVSDLVYNLKINLVQSICGFEMVIKNIDNSKLIIKNFENIIKNGDKKIIKDQGMPIFGQTTRGNLVIIFDVEYPDNLSSEIKNKLADAFEYDNKSKYNQANTVGNGYTLCSLDEYHEQPTETEHTENGERVQCAQQ